MDYLELYRGLLGRMTKSELEMYLREIGLTELQLFLFFEYYRDDFKENGVDDDGGG